MIPDRASGPIKYFDFATEAEARAFVAGVEYVSDSAIDVYYGLPHQDDKGNTIWTVKLTDDDDEESMTTQQSTLSRIASWTTAEIREARTLLRSKSRLSGPEALRLSAYDFELCRRLHERQQEES